MIDRVRPGQSFEDAAVAQLYLHRPEYPPEVYETLRGLSPHRNSLLDLGCGTGKIARGLAGDFRSVTAVDASAAMLDIARRLEPADCDNITWRYGLAETVPLTGAPFDVVVAAASIHWMDHSIVFPRLASAVTDDHVFAVVDGDGALEPPWQAPWDDFLRRWIYRLTGELYEPDRTDTPHARRISQYRSWVEVHGETDCTGRPITQSIASFVACQHSRDTFAPGKLGDRMDDFDRELTELLTPYAEQGHVRYAVRTRVTWGAIECP
jgi:SAM-dependent methyltransferase